MDVGQVSPSFTSKQGQYLDYIYHYTQLQRYPPAQGDIQSFFSVTPPTVHSMILKLEKLGLLERVARKARSLSILIEPDQPPILVRP